MNFFVLKLNKIIFYFGKNIIFTSQNATKQIPYNLLCIEFSICIKNATSHITIKPFYYFVHKDIEFHRFYKSRNKRIIFTFILVVATTQIKLVHTLN